MVPEIAVVWQSLEAAVVMAKGIRSLDNESAVQNAVIDLQQKLLDTQASVMTFNMEFQAMQDRIRQLELIDPEKFELVEPVCDGHKYSGKLVYRELTTGHYFCPVCFGDKKRLVPIQFSSDGKYAQECGSCQNQLRHSDDYSMFGD